MSVVAKRLVGSTWYGDRPLHRRHSVRRDLSPSPKRDSSPHIGAHVLWPNVWMDQYATWYGDMPRPRRPHCVKWGAQLPQKGHSRLSSFRSCLLWPNGWIGQDATWYEGRRRARRRCVRWGTQLPRRKKGHSPHNFRPLSVVAKCLD